MKYSTIKKKDILKILKNLKKESIEIDDFHNIKLSKKKYKKIFKESISELSGAINLIYGLDDNRFGKRVPVELVLKYFAEYLIIRTDYVNQKS